MLSQQCRLSILKLNMFSSAAKCEAEVNTLDECP